jgi:hypothetical protein
VVDRCSFLSFTAFIEDMFYETFRRHGRRYRGAARLFCRGTSMMLPQENKARRQPRALFPSRLLAEAPAPK